MAQVLKVDSEGKPFDSMNVVVCKTDDEAEAIFRDRKQSLLKPEEISENSVWGERPEASNAFGHTFLGRKGNLVLEIVLFEGAGPASREDLVRMRQQYTDQKRELDSLIRKLMR